MVRNVGVAGLIALAASATVGAEAWAYGREDIQRMVVEGAERWSVPASLALALAETESGFRATAESGRGARGVLQIMPATAAGEFGVDADELWDPRVNVEVGLRFLRQLYERYGAWEYALSHYNGGSRVMRAGGPAVIPATRGFVDLVLERQTDYAWADAAEAPVQVAEAPAAPPPTVAPAPAPAQTGAPQPARLAEALSAAEPAAAAARPLSITGEARGADRYFRRLDDLRQRFRSRMGGFS